MKERLRESDLPGKATNACSRSGANLMLIRDIEYTKTLRHAISMKYIGMLPDRWISMTQERLKSRYRLLRNDKAWFNPLPHTSQYRAYCNPAL